MAILDQRQRRIRAVALRFALVSGTAALFLIALTSHEIVNLASAAIPLQAQPRPPQTPKFEVASIKRCLGDPQSTGGGRGGGPGSRIRIGADRVVLQCVSTRELIVWAYLEYASGKEWPVDGLTGMKYSPVSQRRWRQPIDGSPGWLSDLYTIEAKAESPQNPAMMRGPMMQLLLEDRFKLKMRSEKKDSPVYALGVAKGRPKLKAAKEGVCLTVANFAPDGSKGSPCGVFVTEADGLTHTYGQDMVGLAFTMSGGLDRDVVDRTGLTGVYDFALDIDPTVFGAFRDATLPASFAAHRKALEKLGLTLEPSTAPMDQLVIEHIERPSEN